jgi:glycosyltransferase involved in cell wall biosynthesis
LHVEAQNVTAVILCYNEAQNIRHCLESVAGFCDVQVVDSHSTDSTIDICREYTQKVVQHPYENHASQWQWALENLDIKTAWILALDADFVVSDALKSRILKELASIPASIDGIYVRHLYHFGGSLIRFGGTKRYWLRMIRTGNAQADISEMVDFRFVVVGDTVRWSEHVMEYNRNDDDISVWLDKQDKFSIRLAVEEELRRRKLRHWHLKPSFFGNTDTRFAWLRDEWLRLPLFLRPVLYFFYRYVFALGFLDGRGGFLYHSLQGFWLRTIVDWKTLQLRERNFSDEELSNFGKFILEHRAGSVDKLLIQWRNQGQFLTPINLDESQVDDKTHELSSRP